MPLLFFCLLSFTLEPYKMRFQTKSSQGGFSLFELLIVLIIIGVLTTLALRQLGSSRVDFQRQRIVREFKIYLERARFDSVKRRAEASAERASVVLTNARSFTVSLDFDGDGVMRPEETRIVNFADRSDAIIQVDDDVILNYPVTIAFDRRGLVTATDANGPITPLFTICSDCSDTSPDITRISISSSGTVAELRQGQDPQALPTPPPANVNNMPEMNCYILTGGTNCVPL